MKNNTVTVKYGIRNFIHKDNPCGIRDWPIGSLDWVLDLGASQGYFSMLARFLHPRIRVVAVEPDPGTSSHLRRHTEDFDIETLEVAVGAGGVAYCRRGSKTLAHRYRVGEAPIDASDHSVESITLDTLIERIDLPLDKRGFIKIDIEEAERELLAHDPSMGVLRQATCISMELHAETKASYRELIAGFTERLPGHAVTITGRHPGRVLYGVLR